MKRRAEVRADGHAKGEGDTRTARGDERLAPTMPLLGVFALCLVRGCADVTAVPFRSIPPFRTLFFLFFFFFIILRYPDILFLFGGQGIHAFAFAMLIGIITGTYSTIYIASPIVLWLQQRAVVPRTRGATGRSSAQPA